MKKLMIASLATIALSALTTVAATSFVLAGPAQAGAHRGEGMKKLADYLGLTDAQKAQMKPIIQSARQQGRAIKEDTSLTPEAKKAKLKDLHKSTMDQLKSILTPEQIAKLKALRQHQHEAGEKA